MDVETPKLWNFRELMGSWTDRAETKFTLGICMGFFSNDDEKDALPLVLAETHQVGMFLGKSVDDLVKSGILEQRNEEGPYYRWNKGFSVK